jgi:hypothetical protein
MFDFLGRRKADRRTPADRRRGRGPVTIGFEQLEGRALLSSGIVLTVIPSGFPPLANMPRPIVGSIRPEADGEGPFAGTIRLKVEWPAPDRRRSRLWPLGERFRRK